MKDNSECIKKCENCGKCNKLVRPSNCKEKSILKNKMPESRKEQLKLDIYKYADGVINYKEVI